MANDLDLSQYHKLGLTLLQFMGTLALIGLIAAGIYSYFN